MPNQWQDFITNNPDICHGQSCIVGTRIPVSTVLDNVASGLPFGEIIKSYPSLTLEAIQASISYAAFLSKERVIPLDNVA